MTDKTQELANMVAEAVVEKLAGVMVTKEEHSLLSVQIKEFELQLKAMVDQSAAPAKKTPKVAPSKAAGKAKGAGVGVKMPANGKYFAQDAVKFRDTRPDMFALIANLYEQHKDAITTNPNLDKHTTEEKRNAQIGANLWDVAKDEIRPLFTQWKEEQTNKTQPQLGDGK
jgi:hypothetical protein